MNIFFYDIQLFKQVRNSKSNKKDNIKSEIIKAKNSKITGP